MNNFHEKINQALQSLAKVAAPDGTSYEAVVSQWAYAIAFNKSIFGDGHLVDKNNIIKFLKKNDLYVKREIFRDELIKNLKLKPVSNPKFTFIDLFAGIGGMRLGAQNSGGVCVFSSEFDRFSQSTYFSNHGEMPFGDIKKIDEKHIPDHDLLMAGFPCQPFSYAGKCEGFEDQTRGTLFFDVLRIIEEKKPKVVLLENVKGFKSHQNGQTMDVALNALREAGYDPRWKILNSYDFGVPQYRERWYCVATRCENSFVFPAGDKRGSKLKDIVDLFDADESLHLSKFEIERIEYHFAHGGERVKHDNSKYKPTTKKGKHGVYSFQKDDGALRFHIGDFAKTQIQEAFYACLETYSPTIIANRTPKLWDIKRKLSVKESLRLQGFSDAFEFPISNAQAYKQLGNSVTVPVIEEIVKSLGEILR